MNKTTISEKETLERIARRYKKEGFEVLVSPSPSDRPEELRNFHIDLIARRGDETVIVEAKMAHSNKVPPEIQALADRVNRIPNHRFDFVAVQRDSKPAREEWLDKIALANRVEQVAETIRQGHWESSIMLLWSATEGILRLLADRERLTLSSRGPQAMVKSLYSQGIIDKTEYGVLEEAGRARNLAVHGLKVDPKHENLIPSWRRVVSELLRRL